MMKKNIYTTLSLFMLTSCVTQPPAPIETGSSSSRNSGYSENTNSSVSGSEPIIRRDLSANKSASPANELNEKEEAFVEYKKVESLEEKPIEDKQAELEEEKKEIHAAPANLPQKSLEEEMEEIEAEHEVKTPVKQEVSEETIKPDKIVLEDKILPESNIKFAMPVSGKIITRFGEDRGGKKSNGINILATRGAEVKSIAEGRVVYAGQDAKFGNLVIVKVGSTEMFAAYAHMDDLLLQKDDDVAKGEVIGHVGSTGEVTNPELHFAIRKGKTPIDPVSYLNMPK